MASEKSTETVLGVTAGDRNWAIGFGVVAGGTLGALLPLIWQLIDDVDWVPAQGLVRAMMSIDVVAVAVLRPVILALFGGVAMAFWAATQPRLRVSDDEIIVERDGSERVIRKDQVTGAYLEGSTLIIDSTDGRRLFDKDVEGAKKHAGEAFRAHGYPWESR